MDQKLQDLPTMQKTILPKRPQRQQNILRQLQKRQHKSFGSPAILKQTQMGTGIKMKYKAKHKLLKYKPIQTDLRYTGSLTPEFKISNQQIDAWLNSP